MAQTAQGGRGSETTTQVPNTMSTNGADNMKPNAAARPATTSAGLDESQARAKLEANGFSSITGLMVGSDGMWHGRAMKGSTATNVALDMQGNVIAN